MPDARPAARSPSESWRRLASGDVEAVYRSCRAIYRQPDRYLGCLIGARSYDPNATTPVAPAAPLKHRLLPLLLQRAPWCLCLPARQRRIQPPLVPRSWEKKKENWGTPPEPPAGDFSCTSFLRCSAASRSRDQGLKTTRWLAWNTGHVDKRRHDEEAAWAS